jgi:PQQ-like domain
MRLVRTVAVNALGLGATGCWMSAHAAGRRRRDRRAAMDHPAARLRVRPQVSAGGVVAVDRETGATSGGGSPRINVYGVAEFEGRLVRHVAEFVPSPSVDFGPFNAVGATGLGGRILPDFAVVGDGVAWADAGTSAIGFLPGCPPAVPGSDFCAPSWTTDLGSGPGGPAALGDGAAVYSHGTSVSVLDMATGAVLWRADLGSGASRAATTPTAIYAATADGRLVALPAGGCGAPVCAPLWEAPIGSAPAGGVVVGGDVAYVPTATGVVAFAAAGCDAATCTSLTSVATSSPVSGLIVHDGRLIVGTEGGELTAFGL